MKTYKKLRSRQHPFYNNANNQSKNTNNTNSVKPYERRTSEKGNFNHSVIYSNNDLGEINTRKLIIFLS
jgi:hypothetical protein